MLSLKFPFADEDVPPQKGYSYMFNHVTVTLFMNSPPILWEIVIEQVNLI